MNLPSNSPFSRRQMISASLGAAGVLAAGTAVSRADAQAKPASDENLNKIKEIQRREREKGMKENGFWMGQIMRSVSLDEPLNQFLQYDKMIDGLTAQMITDAANKYIHLDNYVQVVLMPEGKKE